MVADDRALAQSIYRHKEWIGLLQPVGLVVEATALAQAQMSVDRGQLVPKQQAFKELCAEATDAEQMPGNPEYRGYWLEGGQFRQLLSHVGLLNLPGKTIVAQGELPEELAVVLPDYGETLKATYGVRDKAGDWVLLIQVVPLGWDLDRDVPEGKGWKASPQQKFERLLRETGQPVGLLFNGLDLRLVYTPRGEASGYVTFPVQAMTEVSGRLILGAMVMLLGRNCLLASRAEQRLSKVLEASRKAQALVSIQLAEQVLDALWELLRGLESAYGTTQNPILQDLAQTRDGCRHIYGGLITTLMRLVFLLYAEERGVMPDEEVYQRYYSVTGLYERLREDEGNYPDTMDQRYGAWAGLLSLFRLVYEGGGPYEDYLPARHGQLFNPDEYPFLEGRTPHPLIPSPTGGEGEKEQKSPSPLSQDGRGAGGEGIHLPQVSDGVVLRMLDKLLMLKGDRLSYRALDVEEIGSVYEGIMGFEVEVAGGPSLAVRSKDVVINLEALLAQKPAERAKFLKAVDCDLGSGQAAKDLKAAKTISDLQAALDKRISHRTPGVLPAGSLYLQPGEERRRSGSHYTPTKLTAPIVATTLQPILAQLGPQPTAEQILALKVCDLAMGSGAFLVETCRQLADLVVAAWDREGVAPAGEIEPLLLARRLVAQRCLYGVDKNPFAVNLAKLSLWLVTLAHDRPFTFVDHALKCGDSLVGLTRSEIGSFGQNLAADLPLIQLLQDKVEQARAYRTQIQALDTETDADAEAKSGQLQRADLALAEAKLVGDVKVAAFFAGGSKKERKEKLEAYEEVVRSWQMSADFGANKSADAYGFGARLKTLADSLQGIEKPITPFSWEVEFPEVFDRSNPGFDAIVGNPPFAGKNTTINAHPEGYVDWLKIVHPESHGNADLVAHFFRRAFRITRRGGALGLIATNTIAQGDTRSTGLRYICNHGGMIYNATRRYRWPNVAAVVVSMVHIFKGG